jgi:hypothetical protein
VPKTFTLPALRVEPDLGERIKANQQEAGDPSMAVALRRLIEHGLGRSVLTRREHETLKELVYQLGQIGNNLNQLARRLNVHGDLQDFQLEDLKAATASLGATDRKIRELLSKSR